MRNPRAFCSPRTRRQGGFSFIEILVVMGIISVLVSMVVVVIPMIMERANRTKSSDNVGAMLKMMVTRATESTRSKWAPYSGKNFVLSVIANRDINPENSNQLEILFSPGDTYLGLDKVELKRYKEVTHEALKNDTDFHELTSYAGRRNSGADKEYLITANKISKGTVLICDDDDGPLHHPAGMIIGWSDGNARFTEWSDMGISPPDDPDNPPALLGDDAPWEELRAVYGR